MKRRDLVTSANMKVYGIDTVTFGDCPAVAIATVAVRKTAELHCHKNPEECHKNPNEKKLSTIVMSTT